jgi:hypothetical protein
MWDSVGVAAFAGIAVLVIQAVVVQGILRYILKRLMLYFHQNRLFKQIEYDDEKEDRYKDRRKSETHERDRLRNTSYQDVRVGKAV